MCQKLLAVKVRHVVDCSRLSTSGALTVGSRQKSERMAVLAGSRTIEVGCFVLDSCNMASVAQSTVGLRTD